MYGKVKNIKEILSDKMAGKLTKSKHTTPWQVRGSEICGKLGCKSYAVFIRLYKLDPKSAEKAYYEIKEKNCRDTEKLYFWLFWKTHKESKNSKTKTSKPVRQTMENSGEVGKEMRSV
jgi:hypothetical protein